MVVNVISTGSFCNYISSFLYSKYLLGLHFTSFYKYQSEAHRLPRKRIRQFPFVFAIFRYRRFFLLEDNRRATSYLSEVSKISLDLFYTFFCRESAHIFATPGCALLSGKKARRNSKMYILFRTSAHIIEQDQILYSEYEKYGLEYVSTEKWILDRALEEYRSASYIVVPSRYVYRTFIANGIHADKLRLVPLGPRLKKPSVDIQAVRLDVLNDEESFKVLFVGNASPRKGIKYLLEAFNRLSIPNKKLVLAGSIEPACRHLVSTTASVEVVGNKSKAELVELYLTSSVLVLPSVEDGYGHVVAEALVHGLPCIVSKNVGSSDLIKEHVNGSVCRVADTNDLYIHLDRMSSLDYRRELAFKIDLDLIDRLSNWKEHDSALSSLFNEL